MNKTHLIILIGLGALLLTAILLFGMYTSYNNREVSLRNQAVAVQKDLHSRLDLMQKQISQVAQVTQAQAEALQNLVIGYADARGGSSGSLATSLQEAIPNMPPAVYTNLQNVIVAARNEYANKQTLLLDIKREHDNVLDQFPSSLFVGGRPRLEVQIVTSSRAEEASRTGVDDDTNVFPTKPSSKPEK